MQVHAQTHMRTVATKESMVKTQAKQAEKSRLLSGTGVGSSRIVEVVGKLPRQLQNEVCSFAEYLLATRSRRKHGKMRLKWAGGLKEYRSRFTSLGLQKQSLAWWTD